ncbi:MAG: hypothetical protein ACR2GY_03245 [Phycisphaerales bacterium]
MHEPKQRIIVDSISFGQVFRFQKILAAIGHAMHPPRLVVALFMLLLLIAVGKLWDAWFDTPTINPRGIHVPYGLNSDAERNDALRPIASVYKDWLPGVEKDHPLPANLDARVVAKAANAGYRSARRRDIENGINPEEIANNDRRQRARLALIEQYTPDGPFKAVSKQASKSIVQVVGGVAAISPITVFDAGADLFVRMPVALWKAKPWFTVFYGTFALIVIAIGGGALCRMSACEVAGRERLRSTDAYLFAFRMWVKLVLALVLPLLIAGTLALLLMAAGFVLFNIPLIDVVGGMLYGINLLFGFLIAFLLLALAFSFMLLLPAVATENCDPADALQRAYAYLLSRPFHLAGYVIVALVGLAVGYFVISLIVVTTLNVTGGLTGTFSSNSALSMTGGVSMGELTAPKGEFHSSWHSEWAGGLIAVWQGILILLVASYVVSYLFSAATVIYLLMRKTVDEQDYSEIWRPGLVPGTLAPMPAPAIPFGETFAPHTSTPDGAAEEVEGDEDEAEEVNDAEEVDEDAEVDEADEEEEDKDE